MITSFDVRELAIQKNAAKYRQPNEIARQFFSECKAFHLYSHPRVFTNASVYYIIGRTIYIPDIFEGASHEFSHIVEFQDTSRLLQDDFGFDSQSVFEAKVKKGLSKAILPGLAREARVKAIQSIISPIDSFQMNPLNNSSGAFETKVYPQGKFQSRQEVVEWINLIQFTTLMNWDFDRIVSEWEKKKQFFNDWTNE